jgi:hypothetical protein
MKKHLLPLALLLSGISPAQALDVGDISSFMNSDSSTLSKTIKNSTDSGRLINIRLERLSSPLDDGQVISSRMSCYSLPLACCYPPKPAK